MAELVEPQVSRYQEYKPTGVEWLPEIPVGWGVNRLRNICRLQGRVGFKGYQVSDLVGPGEGALTIGGKHIRHNVVDVSDPDYISWEKYYESPEIMIETGDIIVAQRGTLGKVAHLVENIGPATINPSLIILKDIHIYNRFLYWYLRSNYVLKVIDMLNTSTAVPMLSQAQFSEFKVLIPSDSEQRAIVQFLDDKTAQLDQLITQKQQMLELLREERAALINHAVTKGLQSDGEDIGIDSKNWNAKRIKFLTKVLRGNFTHRPRNDERLYGGKYPFIQTGDVSKAGKYIENFHQTLNEEGYKVTTEFPLGTLVMTIAATVGEVAILNFNACFPDSVVGFYPTKEVDRDFLYYKFMSLKEDFLSTAVMNTQLNLNVERIEQIEISYPSIEEQRHITAHIESHSARIAATTNTINQEITLLQEYRAALVAEAVTGQLDVRHYAPAPTAVLQ